jgi:hypothetical protein
VPAAKKTSDKTLSLRISVLDPPPNILWTLQLGRDEMVGPSSNTRSRISFDFTVDLVEDSSPLGFRLHGPAVQGRPGKRFVYLRMGAYAGQANTSRGWRAKIDLESISHKLVVAAKSKRAGVLEVQFAGTGPKGDPACATVPLLGAGWYVA